MCPPRLFNRPRRGGSLSVVLLAAVLCTFLSLSFLLRNHVSPWPVIPAPPPHSPDLGTPPPPSPSDPAMSPPVHHHPKKPGTSRRPTVTLRQGRYNGTVIAASTAFAKALDAFRGIPYAQSTAAHNRFRPPQPLPPSDRVFDALEFGKTCPRDGYLRADMSEDCLNLNVYRPAGTTAKKLPVIVYVHGGAFNTGCGIERNMAAFVSWAADPMVAVNFNYRVGPLGFLPSDLTAKEDLLNLGLRDQQLLFQWVQENIAAFGGDPDNVTIMGLSAGAHSVGHHLMYYADHPPAPFAKAILESGATTARAVFLPTHPRHLIQFREFLAAANVNVPEEEVFDRLRQTPLIDIVKASRIVWDKYADSVTWPFQPVIDAPHGLANSSQPRLNSSDAAAIIPDLPITSWRSGRNLRIPVLTGYNTNEGTIFIPHAADTNAEFRHFFQNLIPSLSEADLDALERLYPDPVTDPSSPYRTVPDGKGRQFARLDAAYSHYAYICPVLQTAHFLSTDEQNKNPVYVYRYAARGAFGTANHGDEAPVVAHDMGLLGGKGMEGLRAVADAMHGAWAKFVVSKSGDLKEANWPVYKSPFPQEQADEKWKGTVKRGETPGGDRGQKMVFGEGNDERTVLAVPHLKWKGMKEKGVNVKVNKGVPAQVEGLTDVEMAACRFWWGRVELSEGLGTGKGLVKPRAKL